MIFMEMIITAVLSVTVMGIVCAVILCAASKFMAVKIDEREAGILEILPGTNCGACGYPGCAGYASDLVSETHANITANFCTPGGPMVAKKISEILSGGTPDSDSNSNSNIEKHTAVIHCSGDSNAHKKKMDYAGLRTCLAAKQVFGGEKACAFGCIGYGDCKAVCPSDAVCTENGIARIIRENCTGCALCVKACPNKLITIEMGYVSTVVLCKSPEKGSVVRNKCSRGCFGCGRCVRECPSDAIVIQDNLAVIEYEKCIDCGGHCAEVCITHCIQLQSN